jgi:hypothetical protein
MPLPVFSYILDADLQNDRLSYKWDEWNPDDIFEDDESEEYYEKLSRISYRASTALTVASGEWIVHRYRCFKETNRPEVDQMIEAGWAGVVDGNYHSLYKPNEDSDVEDEWRGPVMYPVAIVNIIIIDAISEALKEEEKTSATSMAALARHVLPEPAIKPFLDWRDRFLDLLVDQYPYDEDETLGEVVPREFFDVSKTFNKVDTENLINKFLTHLIYRI